MILKKENTCFIAGAEMTEDVNLFLEQLKSMLPKLLSEGINHYYVGCTLGFEMCVLEFLTSLKQNTSIKITAVVTGTIESDTKRWSLLTRERLDDALEMTDEVLELKVSDTRERNAKILTYCAYRIVPEIKQMLIIKNVK